VLGGTQAAPKQPLVLPEMKTSSARTTPCPTPITAIAATVKASGLNIEVSEIRITFYLLLTQCMIVS
jgi:hypothetical protein